MRLRISALLAVLLPLAGAPRAYAESEHGGAPYFFVHSDHDGAEAFPLQATDVEVEISGMIADVTVTQRYRNTGGTPIEGEYVFPGSTGAAVHDLTMTIGDRVITAQLEERDAAATHFQQARAWGHTAALLQQHRPNVFQMNVTNVLPNDLVEVKLRYTEIVRPDGGVYRYTFPTVVGPRYVDAVRSVAHGTDWTASPYLRNGEHSGATFSLRMKIEAGIPLHALRSPTHDVSIHYTGPSTADLTLVQERAENANRDFIVEYTLSQEAIESGLLVHEGNEENTFLLTIEPPTISGVKKVVPREYAFVIDTSGSMSGFPLDTAKTLTKELLARLTPDDTFNVIFFAGSSIRFAAQFVPATEENKRAAIRVLEQTSGGGATEIYPALKEVLDFPREEGRARSVVVVTDGFVAVGRELFALVEEKIGSGNLFPFGIGSAVNRHLIEGLAAAGHSDGVVVLNPSDAQSSAARFAAMVSLPVMTDIKLDFGASDVYDLEPEKVTDLFVGRPLTVVGKWRGKIPGEVSIRGISADGEFRRTLPISSSTIRGGAGLEQLWARERVRRLSDLATAQNRPVNREALTALALKYHLLTEFTAFVAVDSDKRLQASNPTVVRQPIPLPQNVENSALGDSAAIVGRGAAVAEWTRGYEPFQTVYNDVRISNSTNAIMAYIEGTFGALVMVVFGGLGIILLSVGCASKSPRQRVAGCLCILMAIACYVLRSMMSTFFNDFIS